MIWRTQVAEDTRALLAKWTEDEGDSGWNLDDLAKAIAEHISSPEPPRAALAAAQAGAAGLGRQEVNLIAEHNRNEGFAAGIEATIQSGVILLSKDDLTQAHRAIWWQGWRAAIHDYMRDIRALRPAETAATMTPLNNPAVDPAANASPAGPVFDLLVRNPAPDAAPPSGLTGISGTYKIGYVPLLSASEPAGANYIPSDPTWQTTVAVPREPAGAPSAVWAQPDADRQFQHLWHICVNRDDPKIVVEALTKEQAAAVMALLRRGQGT